MTKPKTLRQRFKVEATALHDAIKRCDEPTNPYYDRYGGRGITVADCFRCPKQGFASFIAEVGPKPDPSYYLDRIDGDKNYEPGNLRWIDPIQSAQNRRNVRTIHDLGFGFELVAVKRHRQRDTILRLPVVEYQGVRKPLSEWSKLTGVSARNIAQRLRRGWSVERALQSGDLRASGMRAAPRRGRGDDK